MSGYTTEVDDQTGSDRRVLGRHRRLRVRYGQRAHPRIINPVKVRILIRLSQNSTSPKALIPKQLMAMTKKIKMDTQAAELISAFQNLLQ